MKRKLYLVGSAPCQDAAKIWIKAEGKDPAGALGGVLLRHGRPIAPSWS